MSNIRPSLHREYESTFWAVLVTILAAAIFWFLVVVGPLREIESSSPNDLTIFWLRFVAIAKLSGLVLLVSTCVFLAVVRPLFSVLTRYGVSVFLSVFIIGLILCTSAFVLGGLGALIVAAFLCIFALPVFAFFEARSHVAT